jgi:hypothetical protein
MLEPAVHTLVPQVVVVCVIGSPFTIESTTLENTPEEPTAMICGACALPGEATNSEAATPIIAANHLHFVIDTSSSEFDFPSDSHRNSCFS